MTGVYSSAKRLLIAVTIMFSSGLNSVALPAQAAVSSDPERSFARLPESDVADDDPERSVIRRPCRSVARDLIHILMGDKWADVAPVLAILAVNGYVASLSQYHSNIMLVKERSRTGSLSSQP